jgi:hypothetical protein
MPRGCLKATLLSSSAPANQKRRGELKLRNKLTTR